MNEMAWNTIINAAIEAAEATGRPVAEVPLEEIAKRAGISRATLFRRIGSREALEAAIRERGIDPGRRADVRTRATDAAADLIEEGGLAAMTLEAVAARADCSLQALYSQIGGRDALLGATMERFTPLPRIEAVFAGDPPELANGVRQMYEIVFDAIEARRALIFALVADAAGRPDGPTARFILKRYFPRGIRAIGEWFSDQIAAGHMRPLPVSLLVPLLVAPMGLHTMVRPLLPGLTGKKPPDREEVIETLTQTFLRAVALPPLKDL